MEINVIFVMDGKNMSIILIIIKNNSVKMSNVQDKKFALIFIMMVEKKFNKKKIFISQKWVQLLDNNQKI